MDLVDDMTITLTGTGRARLAVRGEVEVDLAEVTFMDSTGLRALADASKELGPVELVLCRVPRQVARILEITSICRGLRCVQ